jgi:hypothetical protein
MHGISWLAEELCIHTDGYLVELIRHIGTLLHVCHCSVWHTMWHHTVCQLPNCGWQHLALTSSHYPTVGVSRFLSTKLNSVSRQVSMVSAVTMPCAAWYKVQFFSLKCPAQLWHRSSLLFEGTTGSLSLRVKWPGHKVDRSPPSSAKAKND